MNSSSWAQSQIKQFAETPRITTGDPEGLIWRLDIVQALERGYYRGLITWRQVRILNHWLETGIILDRYDLLSCLQAFSVLAGYEDTNFIERYKEYGTLTEEELLHTLFELSETLTDILDYKITEEDNKSV